ncbi:MAG TPA: peptidylprolyl isomerase [Candidatus Mcinerneyibacterium sp.]|nr:peptidylprolyl isomerase [Candidatus Mcinerneyibacterium sp.]
MKKIIIFFLLLSFVVLLGGCKVDKKNPRVLIKTNKGDIKLELYEERAPMTVENFKKYINKDYYDNTIIHRVVKDFVIQAGGINKNMKQIEPPFDPIKNEAKNGLSNLRGTVAMARTSDIHSASSHFFINLKDNKRLDYKDDTQKGFGYCVFGKVTEGMNVVDEIGEVETKKVELENYAMPNVPKEDIIIEDIMIVKEN